jgi:uncharacterized protein YaiI (UPF0178 family)
VDADACPRVIRDTLFRAADRAQIQVILVANQAISVPGSRFVRSVQVGSGFDVADDYIVQQWEAGDLVITADIPLAAEVVEKDWVALNPRGEMYTAENVRQRLNMRDFMDTLRGSGTVAPEPAGTSGVCQPTGSIPHTGQ